MLLRMLVQPARPSPIMLPLAKLRQVPPLLKAALKARSITTCDQLLAVAFDANRPTVVVSTGVSMYLTKDAIMATLRQVAALAPGSTFVMSFLLPTELADAEVRPGLEAAAKGARASGTPFISFFTPAEMMALARDAGFKAARHVSAAALGDRYFAGRTDGLRPANNTEELLVAGT